MNLTLPQIFSEVFSEIFKQRFPRGPVDKFLCKYSCNQEAFFTNMSSPCISFSMLTYFNKFYMKCVLFLRIDLKKFSEIQA